MIKDKVATENSIAWYRDLIKKYYLNTPRHKRTDDIMDRVLPKRGRRKHSK